MSDRVKAWQHGLVSDGELEWEKRCLQLAQHAQQHGDAHIGYRDGEDPDLARWARKQRHAHRCNTLTSQRYLQDLYSTALCNVFNGTGGGKRGKQGQCASVCILMYRCNTLTSQSHLQVMYSTALYNASTETRGGKREAGSECSVCIHM